MGKKVQCVHNIKAPLSAMGKGSQAITDSNSPISTIMFNEYIH